MPNTRLVIQKLEQAYLSNGGVAPTDVAAIRKLLQENGIVVSMRDDELAELSMLHFTSLASPTNVMGASVGARSGFAASGCSQDGGSSGAVAPSSWGAPSSLSPLAADARRRMSLAEYTSLAHDVRRLSHVKAATADEDDLEEQLAKSSTRCPGQHERLMSGMPSFGSDGEPSGDSGASSDSGGLDIDPSKSAFEQSGFRADFTAFDDDAQRAKLDRGISLRSLQRRLESVGVPQGMTTIVGQVPKKKYRLRDKVTFEKLKEVIHLGNSGNATYRREPTIRGAFGAVLDAATLFRRLGGDPTESTSIVTRDRILHGLASHGALGITLLEARMYKAVVEMHPEPRMNFDAFLDIVASADLTGNESQLREVEHSDEDDVEVARALEQDGSNREGYSSDEAVSGAPTGTDAVAIPHLSIDGPTSGGGASHRLSLRGGRPSLITSAPSIVIPPAPFGATGYGHAASTNASHRAADIALHDAAAAFLFQVAQGRRKSNLAAAPSERLRQRLANTLNDHLAKTHRSCTFVKGLVYVLRLDPRLLHAFVLRSKARLKNNAFSPFSLAMKILRLVERVVAVLRSHQTCQVCYLKVEPKSMDLPQCADTNNLTNFMRLPQPISIPPPHPATIRPRGVAGLASAAATRSIQLRVGDVPQPMPSTTSCHPPRAAPTDAGEPYTQPIAINGHGFTAKTLYQQSPPGRKAVARTKEDAPSPRLGSGRYRSHHDDDEHRLMDIFERGILHEKRTATASSPNRSRATSASASSARPHVAPRRPQQQRPRHGHALSGRHGFLF